MLKRLLSIVAAAAAAAALTMTAFASSTVTLKSGNYQDWIDRMSLPSYATSFYSTLEEGADGDKNADVLIDYTKGVNLSDGSYAILVDTVTGTASSISSANSAAKTKFTTETEYISAVYYAFLLDHPEVFWLDHDLATSYTVSTQGSGSSYKYELKVYFMLKTSSFDLRNSDYSSASAIYSDISKLNGYVSTIMSGVSSSATDYDKVKYFNKVLTEQNEYNTKYSSITTDSLPSAWQSISALKGSIGSNGPVCEGYSKAFKVLCDEAGIGCTLVSGTAVSSTMGGDHMWNYVKLNGSWYACDITWNDPIVSGVSNKAVSGGESESYLLVGSSTSIAGKKFSATHTVTNVISESYSLALTNGPSLQSSSYSAANTPSAPTISSSFSSTSASATVKWSKVSNASGYRIQRYVSSSSSWTTVATVSGASTVSYTETGLSAGTTYKYRVKTYRTVNGTKFWSGASSAVTLTTLPATAKFNTSKGYTCTTTAIRLNWNKVSGATGYRIYEYNSSAKSWDVVKTIKSGSTLTYKVTGLKAGTTYKFKVRAYKKLNGTNYWGSKSTTLTASTKPTKITVTSASKSKTAVRLNWKKVTGASGYKVQQYIGGKWTTVATVKDGSTLTYKITGLKKGTAYKFRIRAYKKVDGKTLFGAYSATKKVTTKS